ncbi:MAG: diguanylate cyclase, partial [Planctomycetes bacterium]|nr:diguanylate cyclase [Planctomycetota bacterium]
MLTDSYQQYLELQRYVGWTDEDQQRIVAVRDVLLANAEPLVEDFYAQILRHPRAAQVITGGEAQIVQLKSSLRQWLRQLLTGPYDHDYVVLRTKVGHKHVAIGLDQVFVNAALARLRNGFLRILTEHLQTESEQFVPTISALNKLLDLDLAIIGDAYQREFFARQHSLGKENLQ